MEILNFFIKKFQKRKEKERVIHIHNRYLFISKMVNFLVNLDCSYDFSSETIINYNFNKYIQLRELNHSMKRCYTCCTYIDLNSDLTIFIVEILQNKSKFYEYDSDSRNAILDFYLSLIIKYYKKFDSRRYATDKFI